MAKIVVYGGRDYDLRNVVFDALDHIHARIGIEKLMHGAAASGADLHADVWAVTRGLLPGRELYRVPAQWEDISHSDAVIRRRWRTGVAYDARAGHRRNQVMVDRKPDFGVEFPGGAGTFDMRRRMNVAGIPVIQVYSRPHGEHEIEWMTAMFARMGEQHGFKPVAPGTMLRSGDGQG